MRAGQPGGVRAKLPGRVRARQPGGVRAKLPGRVRARRHAGQSARARLPVPRAGVGFVFRRM